MAQEKITELYTNSSWTQCYDNVYVAEALAWSENGNHLTIYATGISADEAQTNSPEGWASSSCYPKLEKDARLERIYSRIFIILARTANRRERPRGLTSTD